MEIFRDFLTERLTTAAVDIFAEVESMIEACYEENTQLRRMLHTVIGPEVRLTRIDADHLTDAATEVREQPSPADSRLDQEITEPLPKKPKEEQAECEITIESHNRVGTQKVENLMPVFEESHSKDGNASTPNLTESVQNETEGFHDQWSASADEEIPEDDCCSSSESDTEEERATEREVSLD